MNTTHTAATYDFYAPIHKGLRLALGNLLIRLGAADLADSAVTRPLFAGLRRQFRLSALHLKDEDAVIHPALESRAPGSTAELMRTHDHHRHDLAELELLLSRLESATSVDREALGHDLYLRFSEFIAHDFEHMHHEETLVLPLLQGLFTDAELRGMEAQIAAMLTPDELTDAMTVMLPAMNPGQRLEFLAELREAAPPEVFSAILAIAQQALPSKEWEQLRIELETSRGKKTSGTA